jgi:hypothetical protein
MASHKVQQGEHITRIARQYGFRDYHTIWDHPQNADLKKQRSSPNVLFPGDSLFIPDKQEKTVQRPTGDRHQFELSSRRLKLRIVLQDYDNLPLPHQACVLEVEGNPQNLQSDANGMIETYIPADAEQGKLTVPQLDLEYPIKIGHLDPVDKDSGWRGRLTNLGYFAPRGDEQVDDLRMHYAIEMFQRDHKLKVTGNLDDATKAKLKGVHGC